MEERRKDTPGEREITIMQGSVAVEKRKEVVVENIHKGVDTRCGRRHIMWNYE